MPEQPDRPQFTPTDDALGMLHDAIDWGRFADIDAARRILLRVAGTGERGHLPLTADQAATFVVDAIAGQIHARGIAEGLRQATEGARQLIHCWWWPDLADARQDFERLVGPWEPADAVTVHRCPPDGTGVMPCCGRTPFEVPDERMAFEEQYVTCRGGEPAEQPEPARRPRGVSVNEAVDFNIGIGAGGPVARAERKPKRGQPEPAREKDGRNRPWPICYAEHRGMLCDRQRGHQGDHVDIYGPLPDHTWAEQPESTRQGADRG